MKKMIHLSLILSFLCFSFTGFSAHEAGRSGMMDAAPQQPSWSTACDLAFHKLGLSEREREMLREGGITSWNKIRRLAQKSDELDAFVWDSEHSQAAMRTFVYSAYPKLSSLCSTDSLAPKLANRVLNLSAFVCPAMEPMSLMCLTQQDLKSLGFSQYEVECVLCEIMGEIGGPQAQQARAYQPPRYCPLFSIGEFVAQLEQPETMTEAFQMAGITSLPLLRNLERENLDGVIGLREEVCGQLLAKIRDFKQQPCKMYGCGSEREYLEGHLGLFVEFEKQDAKTKAQQKVARIQNLSQRFPAIDSKMLELLIECPLFTDDERENILEKLTRSGLTHFGMTRYTTADMLRCADLPENLVTDLLIAFKER